MTTALDRLGFHYYPDEQHYSQRDLDAWLPNLHALGARWLVLRANARRSIPESFVRGLIEGGVQPIIHLPLEVGSLVRAEIDSVLQAYAHWGVRHVAVYDRPNMRRSWREADWSRPNLIDRYLDALLPVLQSQQGCGLRPLLPPLEPGGDYWDTAFLQASLESLARRAPKPLLADMVIGLYSWTNGHGLRWGAGGPAAWKRARPYADPSDSEDHRGVRIFEWYGQIAESILGTCPALIALAGGVTPPPESSPADTMVADSLAIRRVLASSDEAASLQAFAFYLLAADSEHPDSFNAWYQAPDAPGPLAQAFIDAAAQPQSKVARDRKPAPPIGRRYILLPSDTRFATGLDWAALGRLAMEGNGSMGVSVDEAAGHSEVVLAAHPTSYPGSVLEQLETSGCIILQRHFAAGNRKGESQIHAANPPGAA